MFLLTPEVVRYFKAAISNAYGEDWDELTPLEQNFVLQAEWTSFTLSQEYADCLDKLQAEDENMH